ncbi:hypothetical protein BBJ29_001835 [Phytophthora kernoviae]|uniref:FYVE zinc finger domain-containing protein n=1 Tax=Phytophthora kernoviae TaxID=325452 RepID=A0A3F2RR78_9STRA|nr:hypothetical protein BBJ29_001835 [Phytophthora kernoviae]RLN62621.1 hypothetical protein BBP00_00004643 [Phytophthora kernoviae]
MKPKGSTDTKSALELAESSEWSALDRLISAEPGHAEDMDDFGMMPLHWACTDTHVPLRVVKKLVDVAPNALSHKNKGGLLPLHIAVKAATKVEVLRALVQGASDVAFCLFEETPTGEIPTELARAYQLSDDKLSFLLEAEEQLRAAGKAPTRPSARFQAFLNQPGGFPDDTSSVSSFNSLSGMGSGRGGTSEEDWASSRSAMNAVSSALRLPDGLAGVPLPPRWRLDKRCNICQLKFSYFKARHHCRSCGESVCTVVNMYGHGRSSGLPPIEPNMTRQESMPLPECDKGRPPLGSIHSTATSSSSRDSAFQSPSDTDRYFHTSNTPRRIILGDRDSTDNNNGHDPTLTTDLPLEEESRRRPRAWTDVDSTEKFQEMQEQVRELESHVQELTLAKSRIEKELEAANRETKDAKKERAMTDVTLSELRSNRIIDITRISLDDDEDGENRNTSNNKSDDPMEGEARQRQYSIVDPKLLVEDKAVNVSETCNQLGQVFLDRGEFSNAIVEFRKSVEVNRKDSDVWINLARALHGAGELYDAEIAVRRALALIPKNYASLSMLGKILHSKGEHDKAVEVFREALSLMDQEEDSDDDVGSMTVGW